MFNRNAEFSGVVARMRELAKTHPNYVSSPVRLDETSDSYTFSLPQDKDRQITIALLAFDLGMLCATPQYLRQYGTPKTPKELSSHRCLTHSVNEPRNWFFLRGKLMVSQPITPFMGVGNYGMLLKLARKCPPASRESRTC